MKKLNRNQQSVIPRLLENSARGGAWMRMFFMLVIMMMSSAFAMAQGKYGFKVAGVDVTNDNYLDLTEINGVSGKVYFLTSSSCHPKFFVKEFSYFLMPCHQHGLGVNLLVQR